MKEQRGQNEDLSACSLLTLVIVVSSFSLITVKNHDVDHRGEVMLCDVDASQLAPEPPFQKFLKTIA